MPFSRSRLAFSFFCAALLGCSSGSAQFIQQGGKVVGTGAVNSDHGADQGYSVALSANGNTAIEGAYTDSYLGAAWVFTRNGNGNWTQQGSKLVGSGSDDAPEEGSSVALSADGNTALVGGWEDNSGIGAAWVFVRDGNGNWTQQGSKLLGSGGTYAWQGTSVALSGDGNTALVGGPSDSNGAGAVWVFTRDGNGIWTQQGNKLVGSGAVGAAIQGLSVALSSGGNTALIGAPFDNSGIGAIWIFNRDDIGNWTQQGNKLVGSGAAGAARQGFSAALSADGNTAAVGGWADNSAAGAAWIFTRDSHGNWSQQGNKLVGTGAIGAASQGVSVALSGDGNTLLSGANYDNNQAGAAWVFARDGDGNWSQAGSKLVGSGAVGAAQQGYRAALSSDSSTILLGGSWDNNQIGAVWPFVRRLGFALISGSLQQLSVGVDGTIWGINSLDQIFMYDAQTQSFVQAPGDLAQIAVGSDGAVWGLNLSDQIFRYDTSIQSWAYIPGSLSKLAIGADGDAWGLNSEQQIYHFNNASQNFEQIPGALVQIAVGFDGAVWGVNIAGDIYRFNPGTQSFQQVPGLASQIAVGADGDVWALSSETVYHFNRLSQNWDRIAGTLAQLAVGSGRNVWGRDASDNVYQFNSQTGKFVQVTGNLNQISVGENGSVWGVNSTGQIFEFNGMTRQAQTLHSVPGTLSSIAAGPDNNVWRVNSAGQIWAFNPLTQSWNQIAGELAQFAVGFGGDVWGLDREERIWRWNAAMQSWDQIPGALAQIAVGANGDVWGINSQGQIFRYDASIQSWDFIPGELKQLSVGADGTVWGINAFDQIYRWNSVIQSWDSIPGWLSQIAVGSSAKVWGLNAEGQIWRFNVQTQLWDNVPGSLASIAVAFDGAVWGINVENQVWRYDAAIQSWDSIPGSLSEIVVGSRGAVWGLNSGSIYQYW